VKQTENSGESKTLNERVLAIIREDWLTLAVVFGLIAAYAILRTPGDEFSSATELQAQLTDGHPTVIELYANNCSICLVSKPKVDQLERNLAESAQLLRLNVRKDLGQALAYEWGVTGVPTFFVIDGEGQVAYRRAGAPDVETIEATVAELVASTN